MAVDLPTVSEVASAVARRNSADLNVVSVSTSDGASGRVEILITVTDCHREPCRLMVNVSRADRETFESEFQERLQEAIAKHVASPGQGRRPD